jgi:hypothetical protein
MFFVSCSILSRRLRNSTCSELALGSGTSQDSWLATRSYPPNLAVCKLIQNQALSNHYDDCPYAVVRAVRESLRGVGQTRRQVENIASLPTVGSNRFLYAQQGNKIFWKSPHDDK